MKTVKMLDIKSLHPVEIKRLMDKRRCRVKHRDLQLAPGELVPCIRRRHRLAHDVCTLLGSSTVRSTARLSAYPAAFPQALASDVIPPRASCGWHLLRRTNDLS